MSKILDKWVISSYAPETNMGWIDTSGEIPISKIFNNGKWEIVDNIYTSVLYTPQSLEESQKAQARTNIASAKAGTIETSTIATSAWSIVSGKEPFTVKATITMSTSIDTNTIVELFNDDAVLFATYGFTIGAINGLNLDIYSLSVPETNVTLKFNII